MKRIVATILLGLIVLVPIFSVIPVRAYDDYESWYVDPQNPEVQEIIRRECRFPLEDNLAYNFAILYCAVGWRFSYDSSHVHAWQTIPEMLRQNQGVCCDFARLYYSLLRGIGWPENRIEIVTGPVYDWFGNYIGLHAWVEVRTPTPTGTTMALSANESVAKMEGTRPQIGLNETVFVSPQITAERISNLRTLGWCERNGWVPIDPTAGVCLSKIPIIGGVILAILPGLYLTFGYGVFYWLGGMSIPLDQVVPYNNVRSEPAPRRGNPTWDSLNVTINSGKSFNVSYLNDIQPYIQRLSLTESINSTLPVNIETRDPKMQLIQSASHVTSFTAYVNLSGPWSFPQNLGIYWFTVHNTQSVPVNVTFGHFSGGSLGWLGGEDAINQTLYNQYSIPIINTCNGSGYSTNAYRPHEDVYVKGVGYPGSTQITIYVIPDGEDATTSNAITFLTETTDANGTFSVSLLWSGPLNVGNYDVWVDANQNGVFDGNDTWDASVDGLFLFSVVPPDIAVVGVDSSKTIVGQGYVLLVNVAVQNQGYFPESFNVTVYANFSIVGQIVLTLTGGNQTTMTVTWNTAGFAKGNYTLSAYAWPVPGETFTADNNFIGGWVILSTVGDINGPTGWPDGKVDIRDVSLVARHFGETVPAAPANCDLTGPTAGVPDGKIDIRDVSLVARHFGEVGS